MPKDSRGTQNVNAVASRRARISELLTSIESKLTQDSAKATLADFIRLTQLERELEDKEQPREIIITWVDPKAKEDTDE